MTPCKNQQTEPVPGPINLRSATPRAEAHTGWCSAIGFIIKVHSKYSSRHFPGGALINGTKQITMKSKTNWDIKLLFNVMQKRLNTIKLTVCQFVLSGPWVKMSYHNFQELSLFTFALSYYTRIDICLNKIWDVFISIISPSPKNWQNQSILFRYIAYNDHLWGTVYWWPVRLRVLLLLSGSR